MRAGDPSAFMSTTRSARRLPVIVETRSVETITGCRRPREELCARSARSGLRLQPLAKSRMALSGGESVRRERRAAARTRERAKRAKVTSVARSRDPLSRRENAAEISLALVFWWAGVSGYPSVARSRDPLSRRENAAEISLALVFWWAGVSGYPREEDGSQTRVTRSDEGRMQRQLLLFWGWGSRKDPHGAGAETRVTRSDEGRMHRKLLLFWGWGPRKDPRKAGTPAPGEDSTWVSSRGGVLERPDLTKAECRENFFFSGGGVREGIQVKPGQTRTEENQKVFGGGVGEHRSSRERETGNP